jgi:ATP-dependent HslUV protease ATP-binding subunit HslU
MPSFEVPGMPGANIGMINISEMIGKSIGNKEKKKKMTVKESHEILINDESDKLIEEDKIIKSAKNSTENNGIVFLDEIDKISGRADRVGGDVSREGVQRDLLPLIEEQPLVQNTVLSKQITFCSLRQEHFNLQNHLIYYQNFKEGCL